MSLSRLSCALTAVSVLTAASAADACPIGVQGIADPGSTVCAIDLSTSLLYCDVADASGNFNIIGASTPPSTGTGCLPTGGQFFFFEVGCEKEGIPVDRDDPSQQYGGSWLDLRCDGMVQGGYCDHGSYVDGTVAYSPSTTISILMCQCDLLDPTCGVGTCSGGVYTEGSACSSPMSFPASSVVSQGMCGGATIDPTTCDIAECHPYNTHQSAGVCDAFSGANGTESPSPSADLLTYIASVYSVPTSRDFDDVHANEWFGHTFTGLAPVNGAHICGAELVATLGKGVGAASSNDSLGLLFVDSTGAPTGTSYYDYLTSYGISGGSSATIAINIGMLPGGAAMLLQMENGWLDFIVQDDSAVDCLNLYVKYCCDDAPGGEALMSYAR